MKPPIIIDDNGDVSILATVEAAELELEPFLLSESTFAMYDSEGRLLAGRIVKSGWFGAARGVKLEAAEREPAHASVLRQRLTNFLVKLGEPREELDTDSLEALIAKGINR